MISDAFDLIVAPFWICLVLSLYALTLGGLVWRLMVGTILVFTLCIGGYSLYAYFEGTAYWPLPMIVGGPITLIALLALWHFRAQGDPLINSNSWRSALVFLVPLAVIMLLMIGYKAYLSSSEEDCKEMCLTLDQDYEYRPPVFGDGSTEVSQSEACECH